MAFYNNYNNSSEDFENKMAWDLRMVYAKDIIGSTLSQIQLARKTNDFPTWFKLLKRDLATEIYKNLDNEQNKKIEDEIDKVKKIINDNQSAYRKTNSNAQQYENLETALANLEKLMLSLMQINGMFGLKEVEDDGL